MSYTYICSPNCDFFFAVIRRKHKKWVNCDMITRQMTHFSHPLFELYPLNSVHWGINSPSETPPPSFFLSPPHLILQTVLARPFQAIPSSILACREPSPFKSNFSITPKISKFFVLNPMLSFKTNLNSLLKLTEKNSFVYKLFFIKYFLF